MAIDVRTSVSTDDQELTVQQKALEKQRSLNMIGDEDKATRDNYSNMFREQVEATKLKKAREDGGAD